jgi:hypothetical protein
MLDRGKPHQNAYEAPATPAQPDALIRRLDETTLKSLTSAKTSMVSYDATQYNMDLFPSL